MEKHFAVKIIPDGMNHNIASFSKEISNLKNLFIKNNKNRK